jgi:hypothetical protein
MTSKSIHQVPVPSLQMRVPFILLPQSLCAAMMSASLMSSELSVPVLVQVVASGVGQGANSQLAPVRPTDVPSGQTLASAGQAFGATPASGHGAKSHDGSWRKTVLPSGHVCESFSHALGATGPQATASRSTAATINIAFLMSIT